VDILKLTILLSFLLIISTVYATQTIYDNVNITGSITGGGLKVASCDIKASINGTLYCGTDLAGSGGNTTAEMRTAVNQSLYYNFTSNSTTWWANVNDWTSGYFIKSVNSLDFNETKLNNTIDDRLTSFTFYPITNRTIYGTETGGNNIGNLSYYDGQSFNVTEIAGSNPLEVRINFTGIVTFDNILIRERYDGGSGHEIDVELWNYVDGIWDNYFEITDQSQLTQLPAIPVPDSTEHISGNVVMLRFNHVTTPGNTQHKFYIDYVQLIDGTSTLTNIAHDSLSGRDNICINHPWICIYYLNTSQVVGFNYWNFTWSGFNKTYADTLYIGVGNATITSLKNYMNANVSSISNNSLFFNGLGTGYFQNGTETDTANTTTQMRDALNQSLYYNFTSNRTLYIDCTGIYGGSDADFCADATGGGGGVNYLQVSGVWMWNNATSGGQPNINFTKVNATTFYEDGVSLINKYVSVGNVTINAATIDGYDSAFFMPLNVSGLNTAWTSKLGFGNITDYNLDVTWRNKLEWGNISNDPQYNATVNTFITKNVSSIANNSLFFGGYPTGFYLNGTDIDTANTTAQMRNAINQTLYYNITVNDTKNYFGGYPTGFYQNGTEVANTSTQIVNVFNTTGLQVNDDVKIYFGTDRDVFIQYNTTASAGQLG